MKKFYFASGMALFCGASSSNAQGPFRPAITPETDYPINNVPYRSDNTSAYSYSNLNVGSLNAALLDISPNTLANNHYNDQPALAYDPIGRDIYYCWNYNSNVDPVLPFTYNAYIGLKIDNTGNLLMSPPIQYWRVQLNPADISPAPSIALSGQNTSNPSTLFMAFTQQKNTAGGYCMTTKLNTWTQSSFRPGQGTGINEHALQNTIQVVPNPFNEGFQLYAKTLDNKIYQMRLTDVLGRNVLSGKGTIAALNSQLEQSGLDQLPQGSYFLKLWINNHSQHSTTFKLIKTQ